MAIYVDGSTHPTNPGPGGFAVVVLNYNNKVVFCHQEQALYTTNNAMELSACLYALITFGKQEDWYTSIPVVYSDSAYAINTLMNWKNNWKQNNWLKSDNKEPENLNLIKIYDMIESKGYRIELRKIKGHNGELGNEIADALASGRMTEEEVFRKYG